MPHVTFIHGINNKPAPDVLLRDWLAALAGSDGTGVDLHADGVTTGMVYWADVLYAEPEAAEELEEISADAVRSAEPAPDPAAGLSGEDKVFVEALQARLNRSAQQVAAELVAQEAEPASRALLLPEWAEKRLIRRLARDTHHYLFDETFTPRPGETFRVREEIRRRFVAAVEEGAGKPGRQVVVSHSMGTVIAYDCLKYVDDCPPVDGLITLGSPLGLAEVQDRFDGGWSQRAAFPDGRLDTDGWCNVYDRLDYVCALDPTLADDYRSDDRKVVADTRTNNRGLDRHASREYLSRRRLRRELKLMLGI